MRIQIRRPFVEAPYAPFQIGEVLEVTEEVATPWINAGNAVKAGSVPMYRNPPSLLGTRGRERKVSKKVLLRETR